MTTTRCAGENRAAQEVVCRCVAGVPYRREDAKSDTSATLCNPKFGTTKVYIGVRCGRRRDRIWGTGGIRDI